MRNYDRRFGASLAIALLAGCSNGSIPSQPPAPDSAAGATDASPAAKKPAQYLYVYNTGKPGSYSGEFARYGLPDLKLLGTTAADGVASTEAFDPKGLGYFVDEAPQGNYAVFQQPIASKAKPAIEQFSGVPCQSSSLATGPTGNFYVVQYCSQNVLEFKPGATKQGKPKKPIARYTGGNLTGTTDPTAAAVDSKGDLYVGDNAGGVTYFAAGSTKAAIAYATGKNGGVNQIVIDTHDNAWSVHYADPSRYYFNNKTSCVVQPSGPVVRSEIAEEFSKGKLVQHLYTAPSTSSQFASQGVSIALASDGRAYIGADQTDEPSYVLDYPTQQGCPDSKLALKMVHAANPQVTVDRMKRWYVTDYIDNVISAYDGGTLHRIAKITQASGIISVKSAAINP